MNLLNKFHNSAETKHTVQLRHVYFMIFYSLSQNSADFPVSQILIINFFCSKRDNSLQFSPSLHSMFQKFSFDLTFFTEIYLVD